MMHVEATGAFEHLYKKLPLHLQTRAKKAIEFLKNDSSHPSLGHKKMAGYEDIYEFRVSKNYRVTYQKIGDTAYLRKIGTHDILNQP